MSARKFICKLFFPGHHVSPDKVDEYAKNTTENNTCVGALLTTAPKIRLLGQHVSRTLHVFGNVNLVRTKRRGFSEIHAFDALRLLR